LNLISGLEELSFDEEYRIKIKDGSLETTTFVFEEVTKELKKQCNSVATWKLDEGNLEGIRMKLASGGFFMLRQSLHDPVISMQVESVSTEEAKNIVLEPVLKILSDHVSVLDLSAFD
jgi:phosphomannomutase